MRGHEKIFIGDKYHLRLGIYPTNVRYIQSLNRRKGITFRLGANEFACYTPTEYKNLLCLFAKKSQIPISEYDKLRKKSAKPPESFDWRDQGAANTIKDQGQCGSGYAFVFIASSETCNFISTRSMLSFSELNIIDCSIFCHGCNGGYPQDVFSYVMQAQKG